MLAIGLIHASLLLPRGSSERVSSKKDSAAKSEEISDATLHSYSKKDRKIAPFYFNW